MRFEHAKSHRRRETHPFSGIEGKQQVIRHHDGFITQPLKLSTTAPGPPTQAMHKDRKL